MKIAYFSLASLSNFTEHGDFSILKGKISMLYVCMSIE